jgi:hypothetical protein
MGGMPAVAAGMKIPLALADVCVCVQQSLGDQAPSRHIHSDHSLQVALEHCRRVVAHVGCRAGVSLSPRLVLRCFLLSGREQKGGLCRWLMPQQRRSLATPILTSRVEVSAQSFAGCAITPQVHAALGSGLRRRRVARFSQTCRLLPPSLRGRRRLGCGVQRTSTGGGGAPPLAALARQQGEASPLAVEQICCHKCSAV